MARFAKSSVFEWLDEVRERPGMTVSGGALAALESMVHGYYVALGANGLVEAVPEMSQGHFGLWLRQTKRWSLSLGWAHSITEHAGSRAPLDLFFDLVDRYRTLAPTVLAAARLGRRHSPTGKRVVIGMSGRMPRPSGVEIVRYQPTRLHFLRFMYGTSTFNESILMDGNGSHATSLAFAKRWCADELQTMPYDWRRA